MLSAGSELFKLIRQSRLEWRATLSADQLGKVAPGQTVALRFAKQEPVAGRVRQVSPVVDAATLEGTIYVDLPEPGALKAGMFVSGEIQFGTTPARHLPESTLVYRDGYQYVMKVDAAHRVHQLKVTTECPAGFACSDKGLEVDCSTDATACGNAANCKASGFKDQNGQDIKWCQCTAVDGGSTGECPLLNPDDKTSPASRCSDTATPFTHCIWTHACVPKAYACAVK